MAQYSVSDSEGGPGFSMESADDGMVKLTIRSESVLVTSETAQEIRSLMAVVIADAQGGGS